MDDLQQLWEKKLGGVSGSGSRDCDAAGTGSHFDETPSINGVESGLQSPYPSLEPSGARTASPPAVCIHCQTKRPRTEKSQNSAQSLSSSRHPTRGMNLIFKRRFSTKRLKKYRPSITLENAGNVARDHLASERTFLAYVRTSLALASTGVALVQLFTIAEVTSRSTNTPLNEMSRNVQKFARPLGVTTVLLALVVLGLAVYRYFLIQNSLPEKQFPVARYSIVFVSFSLGAVVVVIFAALIAERKP